MPNTQTLLIIFIGITAAAVVLQACVLLGLLMAVRKALETGKEEAEDFRSRLSPVIENGSKLINSVNELAASAQKLVNDVRPHLQTAVTELATMSRNIHAEANRPQTSVDEVATRARYQVDRVDRMTTTFLNGMDRFGQFLNEAVHAPLRQVNGVVAAAKAVVETLRSPSPQRPNPRPARPSRYVADDKDLFV